MLIANIYMYSRWEYYTTLPAPNYHKIYNRTKTPTMPLDTSSNKGGAEGAVKAGTSTVSATALLDSHHTLSHTNTARQRCRWYHQDCRWSCRHSWSWSRRDHQQHHRHQGRRRWSSRHHRRYRRCWQLRWQGSRECWPGKEELVKG